MSRLSTDSGWTALLAGQLVAGIGIGLANPAIAQVALGVVAPERSGMASGLSNTFRIGGLATGIAGLGAVFQHQVQSRMAVLVPGASHALVTAIVASGPAAAAAAGGRGASRLRQAGTVAFVSGTHWLLVVGAATVAVGVVCAFGLIRGRDLLRARGPSERTPVAEGG